jgi:hypothetical protein
MNKRRQLLGRNSAAQATAATGSDALPVEVATVIAASTVLDRSTDEEARLLVIAPGYGSFVYERSAASEWMKGTFGELTEAQVSRALHMLHAHVTRYQRVLAADVARRQSTRSSWREWRPLEK